MTTKERIAWFKNTFHRELNEAVQGTPFDVNLLVAIAYQETGYIWGPQVGKLDVEELLKICVGDTLDSPSRSAFPKNKAQLLRADRGDEMFVVARQALLDVGELVPAFKRVARRAHKFCRGFGVFQYDLQFFKEDPEFFLQHKWHVFDVCVQRFIEELRAAQRRQRWASKVSLTDREQVFVAIAYNRGRAVLSKGFKQGHKSGGKYYGENIDRFFKIAKRIEVEGGEDPVIPPIPVGLTEAIYRVSVNSFLNMREAPSGASERVAKLPAGQLVQRLEGDVGTTWWEVEAALPDGPLRGFVASRFLKKVSVLPPLSPEEPVVVDFAKQPRYIRNEIEKTARNVERGERGKRVQRVQEWLWYHKCRTGIDADFGPATERCVRRFQNGQGLTENGKVDQKTWKALVAPMQAALAKPLGVTGMTDSEALRAVADQHLAVHPVEIGGANRGPWVRLYCEGNDGPDWPWCAGFVSLIMHQAFFYRGLQPPIQGSVSCDALAAQAKEAGMFVHESEITSGQMEWSDLGTCGIFLRRRTSWDWTHTGLAFDGVGETFETIEGNTNDSGSRDGFEACRRTRSVSRGNYDFVRFV